MRPIFIAYTRSFWFGIVPTVLTALDILFTLYADPGAQGPVSMVLYMLLGTFFDVQQAQIEATMKLLAPLYALIIAQQRSGSSRPYCLDPRAK